MKIALFTFITFACIACNQSKAPVQQTPDTLTTENIPVNKTIPQITERPYPTWMDTLVTRYANSTFKHEVSWLWDDYKETDTATYAIFHLGHSFENHFATDGWLYIDTITRNIYEYDIPGDSLISWKK
jgi:hypothetical protein